MDGYPSSAWERNVPLLVASGLQTESSEAGTGPEVAEPGVQLLSKIPPLHGNEAQVLRDFFEDIDKQNTSWSSVDRGASYHFRIKTVGRSYILPSRREKLLETIDGLDAAPTLHSPFSPLSPSCKLYPDGLIDSQWIEKHQEQVPSIYACFYNFSSDHGSGAIQDARLRADVNSIKVSLATSGYKTRLMLVLLGDGEGESGPLPDGVQDRLELIRKEANLDPKSIFYIPLQESPDELRRVVGNVLGVFYGNAIEYYRELGRHAKKKRSRGIVPPPTVPPTGTSHTLSLSDWNFRYDFKAAVFAEFRQEADAAMRSFEQAYEILLGSDVLDVIPNWSTRWNEARLLSDIISIRCMRIHFWMGQTSLAVRRWQSHRERIGEFVDRRGMGTNTYGWKAWEARWALVMVNLMERIRVPGLAPSTLTLFLEPDKAVLGERLNPWELLHHPGYWYRLAAQHLADRRRLAHMIPEDDRRRPESKMDPGVNKTHAYDTYMCPEPFEEFPIDGNGVNHSQLILDCLMDARREFMARRQLRMSTELLLDAAREMTVLELWEDLLTFLEPLWKEASYRAEEWLEISEDLSWLLRRASAQMGRAELVVAIDWELMNQKFTRRSRWNYDLSKALDTVSCSERPVVGLDDSSVSSPITASFVFRNKETKAGEVCVAQASLHSVAFANSVPITLSSVSIEFEGCVKPIILKHDDSANGADAKLSIEYIHLKEEFASDSVADLPQQLSSRCNLTLRPGQRRVYEMTIPVREAGEATASTCLLSYRTEDYDLDYKVNFRETDPIAGWYVQGSAKPKLPRSDARTLQVLPRPPKLEIRVVNCFTQYYANEPVDLQLELLNAEDETATAKLDVHVFGKEVPSFRIVGQDEEQSAPGAQEQATITGLSLGKIQSNACSFLTMTIDPLAVAATLDVDLRATYHLESDAATPIIQMLTYQLNVMNPFEANYDLVPRLHQDPWPSLFDCEGIIEDTSSSPPRGFAQKWCLICHYASFAREDLKVVDVEMEILSCVGGARCSVVKGPSVPAEGITVSPQSMNEAQFDLVVQKMNLDDRHSVTIDLAFVIKWQRQSTAAEVAATTTMAVGKFLVLGTEPRVLASVYYGEHAASNTMQLDVTVENPSGHFLTFGLGMDPSDEFAFSGAKQTTLHLLPMARRTKTYRLVPLVSGRYIRPRLVVRDKYFQKVLRIIPTEGMKIDKDGLLVWVPGDSRDQAGGGETDEDAKS